jgi:hypothetical protein
MNNSLSIIPSQLINPYYEVSISSFVDEIFVLPLKVLMDLGCEDLYTQVSEVQSLIDKRLQENSERTIYLKELSKELKNTGASKVLLAYGSDLADIDFEILELLLRGSKSLVKYRVLLDKSCMNWSISVFSKPLSDLKLTYLASDKSDLALYDIIDNALRTVR